MDWFSGIVYYTKPRIKNQMWGFLCRVKFFNGNHWQRASPLQPQWRSFWLRSFRLSRHDRIRTSESHGCHGSKCQTPRIHQWIRWNISCYIINIGNLWPFTMSKSEILFGDSQLQHLQAPQLARPSVEPGDRYRMDLTCKKSYLLWQNIYSSQTERERDAYICIYIYIRIYMYIMHDTLQYRLYTTDYILYTIYYLLSTIHYPLYIYYLLYTVYHIPSTSLCHIP